MSDLEWGVVFGLLLAFGFVLAVGVMFWWMFIG